MKETPNAQQAFEDYFGLGPERSIEKLVGLYAERKQNGEEVPSTTRSTIAGWSTEHNWQKRVLARVEEDAAEIRKRLQERSFKFRERIATAIEVDVTRLLQRLRNSEGEMLAESATDLEKLVKLYYQLAEQPLADRSEVTADVSAEMLIRRVLEGADGRR